MLWALLNKYVDSAFATYKIIGELLVGMDGIHILFRSGALG